MSNPKEPWRGTIRKEYEKVSYDERARQNLRRRLELEIHGEPVAASACRAIAFRKSVFSKIAKRFHTSGLGYVAVAVSSAALSVAIVRNQEVPSSRNFLDQAAALRHTNHFPADFDLEGNPELLPEVVSEALGNTPENFHAEIPALIRDEFEPGEGRFVSFHGGPGVAVRLARRQAALDAARRAQERAEDERVQEQVLNRTREPERQATLYIVNLPRDAQNDDFPYFPYESLVRQVNWDGVLPHQVRTWRQGSLGYVLVSDE